jgi:hypothetical protein
MLDAWAEVVWEACWQGSLVVLAVWFICRVMPSMPARCRFWLWRLDILKFTVVPVLPKLVDLPFLSALPVAGPLPEVPVRIVTRRASASQPEEVGFQ